MYKRKSVQVPELEDEDNEKRRKKSSEIPNTDDFQWRLNQTSNIFWKHGAQRSKRALVLQRHPSRKKGRKPLTIGGKIVSKNSLQTAAGITGASSISREINSCQASTDENAQGCQVSSNTTVRTNIFEPLLSIINKLANGENLPPQITMRYEMLRFYTLRFYPKENKPYITRIAQAGFYFANNGDEVVCYCCGVKKSDWTETDIPMDVHRKLNPYCMFLRENSEVNIPIKTEEASTEDVAFYWSERIFQAGLFTTKETTRNSLKRQFDAPSKCIVVESAAAQMNTVRAANQSSVGDHHLPVPSVDSVTAARFEPLINIINKMADGQNVPTDISMRYEMLRFGTLRSYPTENKPSITRMAQAGFYYANNGDEIICYCCGTTKSHWKETDNPSDIHRQLNPYCRFLLQNAEVNVPNKDSATSPGGSDDNYYIPRSAPTLPHVKSDVKEENSANNTQETEVQNDDRNERPQQPVPKYSKFTDYDVRVQSFIRCGDICIQADTLAESGFFYAGVGDCVRCFQCGLGLRNWSEEDDPWIEHSRWSKDCSFVRKMRGKKFVDLVQMAVHYSQTGGENDDSHSGEGRTGETGIVQVKEGITKENDKIHM